MATLAQSTAYTRMFMMIDSSDHITGKTGLTVTVTLSKAGAAFGAAGGSITEVSSGWYKIALNTTDTNTLGDLAYHCTATGADPTDFVDQVNLAGLDANVTYINGSLTSGNNATLYLKALDITNSAGTAVTFNATGSNGKGLAIAGNGSGQGVTIQAGATNANGLSVLGGGSGAGFACEGGATGIGFSCKGGATSGHGFVAEGIGNGIGFEAIATSNNSGFAAVGSGTEPGFHAIGGATGPGAKLEGGATSGYGLTTPFVTGLSSYMFLMVDSSDHITPKTGLTVACQRSIDGAAFANCTNTPATEIGSGWYKITLSAADMNGTLIAFKATATGADARNQLFTTAL